MANIKSAIKRVKKSNKANVANTIVRSSMKTAIKKFESTLTEGNLDEAKNALSFAVKKIDMAASKGVLHKNAAARKKSNLAIKLNSVKAQ